MNADVTLFFKEMLEMELSELMIRADATVTELLLDADSSADPMDRAAKDLDRAYTLRIRDRESKLMAKIKKALKKIEEGEFGICEECGDDISIERLKIRPVTDYCIICKTRMEALEKASGF